MMTEQRLWNHEPHLNLSMGVVTSYPEDRGICVAPLVLNPFSRYRSAIVGVFDLHEFGCVVSLIEYFRRYGTTRHNQFNAAPALCDQSEDLVLSKNAEDESIEDFIAY
jgi:hypothetical protein